MSKIQKSPLICNYACFKGQGRENVFVIPQKVKKCPKGFSEIQLMALSIIKSYEGILSYWQITELINQVYEQKFKEAAVRGALERLYKYDFIQREHIRKGAVQGNKYTLKSDPCLYIKKFAIVDSFAHASMEAVVESSAESIKQTMQNVRNDSSNASSKKVVTSSTVDQSDEALFNTLMESGNESK